MTNKNITALIILVSIFIVLMIVNLCLYVKDMNKSAENISHQLEIVENDSVIVATFYDGVEKAYSLDFSCHSTRLKNDSTLYCDRTIRQYAKVGIHNFAARYDSDTFNDDEFAILIKKYVQKYSASDGIVLDYFEIKRINLSKNE